MSRLRPAALSALLLALAGCGSSNIAYTPSVAPAASTRRVALKVVDNRLPKEGGREPALVGLQRSAVGIKAGIKESSPESVANLVRSAAEDGLGQAGIGIDAGARTTLTAQVLGFWMDWSGYDFLSGVAYKGTITVEYTLQDASGRTIWKGLVMTEEHAKTASKEVIFGKALKRLAARTTRLLKGPDFPALP